jgi:hypothetical protein
VAGWSFRLGLSGSRIRTIVMERPGASGAGAQRGCERRWLSLVGGYRPMARLGFTVIGGLFTMGHRRV